MRVLNEYFSDLITSISRRKCYTDRDKTTQSSLSQVLSTFDLVNLGVGSILGAGLYVVTGQVVLHITGPSAVISYLIAAFASLLAGLCYAEFGSRVPNTTGSAYAYSYYTVGELFAFIIGWNLVLEYVIGTAADARALSEAINNVCSNKIKIWTRNNLGRVPYFNYEYDLVAALLSLVVTFILSIGVKESVRCTTLFNFLNILVAIFITLVGATYANTEYWGLKISSKENEPKYSFNPNGITGIFRGAATCFYAFVGFDIIATTGEEAKNPMRSISIAISLTLLICLSLYLSVGLVISLMIGFNSPSLVPYEFSIISAFRIVTGSDKWYHWVVSFGSIFGLVSSLLGSQFPLPRIIYAMAKDGLLFSFLAKVCARTETPIYATVFPGLLTALFAIFLDLTSLVEMMSSGTLLAYSLVCTSVLLLRYHRPENEPVERRTNKNIYDHLSADDLKKKLLSENYDEEDDLTEIKISDDDEEGDPNAKTEAKQNEMPTNQVSKTSKIVNYMTTIIWIDSIFLALCLKEYFSSSYTGSFLDIVLIVLIVSFTIVILIAVYYIAQVPQDSKTIQAFYFAVPFLPYLPVLAIFLNINLMVQLSRPTWIRFTIWNFFGLLIYFFHGMKNARLNMDRPQEYQLTKTDDPECEECILLERKFNNSTMK